MKYLHPSDIFLLKDAKLAMVIIFLFDHLGHFLELVLVSLREIGPDSYNERTSTKE